MLSGACMCCSAIGSFFTRSEGNNLCEPWCWYIHLHSWVIFRAYVGTYSTTMDRMWEYLQSADVRTFTIDDIKSLTFNTQKVDRTVSKETKDVQSHDLSRHVHIHIHRYGRPVESTRYLHYVMAILKTVWMFLVETPTL